MTAIRALPDFSAAQRPVEVRRPSPLRAWVLEEFATLLDTVGGPSALLDARGHLLHATAAWSDNLPVRDRSLVEAALRKILGASIGVSQMQVTAGAYTMKVSLVQLSGTDRPCAVATLLNTMPTAAVRQDWRGLAEAHGLPSRMAEVAGLIAEGLTNDEIAERMQVSPATVRRQTERILRRLGIERRSGVAGRLAAPNLPDAG